MLKKGVLKKGVPCDVISATLPQTRCYHRERERERERERAREREKEKERESEERLTYASDACSSLWLVLNGRRNSPVQCASEPQKKCHIDELMEFISSKSKSYK